eukprot:sb/3466350/
MSRDSKRHRTTDSDSSRRRRRSRSSSSSSDDDRYRSRESRDSISHLVNKYSSGAGGVGGAGISQLLKSVLADTLNSPEVKSMITELTSQNKGDVVSSIIESQLTNTLAKNIGVLASSGSTGDIMVPSPTEMLPPPPPRVVRTPLETYVRDIFEKRGILYRDEGEVEPATKRSKMVLLDYKIKFLLRTDHHSRVLPLISYKVMENPVLYCRCCRLEFNLAVTLGSHAQSYLHRVISGHWWGKNYKRKKLFDNRHPKGQKVEVWCVMCSEKRSFMYEEELSKHLRCSYHQFNKNCWHEVYDTLPRYEWTHWEDVKFLSDTLPASGHGGFDWISVVEKCVLPKKGN